MLTKNLTENFANGQQKPSDKHYVNDISFRIFSLHKETSYKLQLSI